MHGWVFESCIDEHERKGNFEHFGSGPEYETRKPCSAAAYARLFESGAHQVRQIYEEDRFRSGPELEPLPASAMGAVQRLRHEISDEQIRKERGLRIFVADGLHAISVGKAHMTAALALGYRPTTTELSQTAVEWSKARYALDRDAEHIMDGGLEPFPPKRKPEGK